MFNGIANAVCNNKVFSCQIMVGMHETTERLYDAALKLKGAGRPTDVGTLIDESPQTLKNWESRGVSNQGVLKAAAAIGCRAEWIKTGNGPMAAVGDPILAQIIDVYYTLPAEFRDALAVDANKYYALASPGKSVGNPFPTAPPPGQKERRSGEDRRQMLQSGQFVLGQQRQSPIGYKKKRGEK